MGILIKNLNELEIKDEFNKEEVMSVFSKIYDDWKMTELRDEERGCGRSGMDGMTTQDVKILFNQLVTVLYYNGMRNKSKHTSNEIK